MHFQWDGCRCSRSSWPTPWVWLQASPQRHLSPTSLAMSSSTSGAASARTADGPPGAKEKPRSVSRAFFVSRSGLFGGPDHLRRTICTQKLPPEGQCTRNAGAHPTALCISYTHAPRSCPISFTGLGTTPRPMSSFDGGHAAGTSLVEQHYFQKGSCTGHLVLMNVYALQLWRESRRWLITRMTIENLWFSGDVAALWLPSLLATRAAGPVSLSDRRRASTLPAR